MGGLTPGHLVIVLVIVLVVVGPGKLPELGSALGKSLREFQKAAGPMKDLADPANMLGLTGSSQPAAAPQGQPIPAATMAAPMVAAPMVAPDAMAMPQQLPPMYAPQPGYVPPQAYQQAYTTMPSPVPAEPMQESGGTPAAS